MEERVFDVVVVGGGIAGLTAAWCLRDRDLLLLEKSDRVGGRVYSIPRGDYWLNFGAHLFPAPGSVIDSMCTDLGLEIVAVPGSIMGLAVEKKIADNGRLESYPLRLPLSLHERLAFIRVGVKIANAIRQYNRLRRDSGSDPESVARERILAFLDGISFREFLGRLPGRVEAIFRCAAHRATAEPEQLSAGAGIGLFANVWGGKHALIARNLRGGSAVLPQALARELRSRILPGAGVTEVLASNGRVSVVYENGGVRRRVQARQAIIATPAPVTSSLVRDLPKKTVQALKRITYGPFVSVAILTRERERMPWDHVYAIATPDRPFDMFFNHANILRTGPRRPGGSVMIYAGAGLAKRLLDKSDDEVTAGLFPGLFSLFPSMSAVIEESVVQRWELGNVFASPGRHELQAALEGPFGGSTVQLAGDYFAELGTMEAAAKSGREAARRVRKALSVTDGASA